MPASTSRTPCEHLLGGEQVDAAELVVVAPVAPGRAGRALLSTASSRPSPSVVPTVALYRPVGLAYVDESACRRRST